MRIVKRLSVEKLAMVIKDIRANRNITQEQLGEDTGINRLMISRIERMEYIPSVPQLEKLAEVLGFSIPDLFEDNNRPAYITSMRSRSLTQREQLGVNHLTEMTLFLKQQLMVRNVHDSNHRTE